MNSLYLIASPAVPWWIHYANNFVVYNNFVGVNGPLLKHHIHDYVLTNSKIERDFVAELHAGSALIVYNKLPRGVPISTPIGDYNPDWAISFKQGKVNHC